MAEIYVTSTADSGAGSLRAAIADAHDGDVILFDSDVFPAGQTTSILLSSYITINKSVSVYGGESDGQGGYTSGATKRFYVYRDIDNVKTKVYIDDETPAQDGETVLFENVCRVALDGQNATRCIFSSSADTSINLFGIGFNAGNAGASANGGGVYLSTITQNIISACAFNSCSALSGGGIVTASTSQNNVNNCSFVNCNATNGGATWSTNTSQNTLSDCIFDSCNATSSGGAVYSTGTSVNTLNDCTISGCSATASGGGIFSGSTSQNTLNDCTITDCRASNGGGVYSSSTSQNTLNDCTITGCSATNGGALYATNTSANTLNGCLFSNNTATANGEAFYIYGSSVFNVSGCDFVNNNGVVIYNATANIESSTFDVLTVGSSSGTTLTTVNINGITKVGNFTLRVLGTVNINDGAALTITTSATIGAATFTSAGRGYLAVAAGIDVSAATLTNVVLCAYGADVSSFAEVDGVLEWEAANPTTTVLIERADGDSWTTVTQTAGESLTLYLPPSDTVRLFDGVHFFTAQAPETRTYYYIGGADGSFTSAADWSLRRGGAAITEPPVVRGQRFIVGDISPGE